MMTEIYKQNLLIGEEYQDFVVERLYEIGLAVISYSSKRYQNIKGENKNGWEIKYDRKFRETRNLYIEVEEKTNKNNKNFVKSGIFRVDNTWLYIIGDYKTIYILSKTQLQRCYKKNRYKIVQTLTSIGMLIPILVVDKFLCLKRIDIVNK